MMIDDTLSVRSAERRADIHSHSWSGFSHSLSLSCWLRTFCRCWISQWHTDDADETDFN